MYCRTCLDRALDLAPSCPVCRTRLDSLDHCSPAPRAILHLVADLAIQCTACSARMRRDDWQHHHLACSRTANDDSAAASTDQPADDSLAVEHCDLCSTDIPAADAQVRPPPTHWRTLPRSH